eukprot:GEMP01034288.1.p1 GENE.GEMP01034288.1~~GEMP01034288.1.p1  ORF type:complete len:202 (+),score=30.32 GEMP01034288.1:71-607(+)
MRCICGFNMGIATERPPVYADAFIMTCEKCSVLIEKVTREEPVMHCAACCTDYCSRCTKLLGPAVSSPPRRRRASDELQHARVTTAETDSTRACTPLAETSHARAWEESANQDLVVQSPAPRPDGGEMFSRTASFGDARRPIIKLPTFDSCQTAAHLRTRKSNLRSLREIELRARSLA